TPVSSYFVSGPDRLPVRKARCAGGGNFVRGDRYGDCALPSSRSERLRMCHGQATYVGVSAGSPLKPIHTDLPATPPETITARHSFGSIARGPQGSQVRARNKNTRPDA